MPSLPNPSDPASPSPPVALSTALLALRERSRALLRERSHQLQELEARLQDQFTQLLAECTRPPTSGTETEATRQRIATLEAEVRHLQQLRRDSEQALDEARVLLVEMDQERQYLRERIESTTAPAPPQPAVSPDTDAERERLQRRLEMAMQEIRELKQQNQELASRPAPSAAAPRAAPPADHQSFDWETQKKRLLQELETDFDTSQPAQAKDKLRIEEVIRETSRIIAEKDREIESLRQQLEALSSAALSRTAESSARDQLVDADERIAAERAKLHQIQEEWREKLRQSEVEISIERAKLARERLQLEEKLRSLPSRPPEEDEEGRRPDDPKGSTPPRGRWLTRLGLGGNE